MAELGVSAGLLEVPQEPEIPLFLCGKNLDFVVRLSSICIKIVQSILIMLPRWRNWETRRTQNPFQLFLKLLKLRPKSSKTLLHKRLNACYLYRIFRLLPYFPKAFGTHLAHTSKWVLKYNKGLVRAGPFYLYSLR